MKKILNSLLFVLAALALTACSEEESNALAAGDDAQSSAMMTPLPTMSELSERLDLSEAQVADLETVFQDLHEAMAARHSGDASMADTYPMMDFIEASSAILTPEQFVALASVADEHHEKVRAMHRAEKRGLHRRQGEGRHAAGPRDEAEFRAHMEARHARRMDMLTNVLELSDGQRAQLEALFASQREVHEQMLASGERPMKERMQEHHEAMVQQMNGILTPEQRTRFEALQSFGWGVRHGPR